MTHDEQQNLEIDPAMIVLGIGYLTSLCVAIGLAASALV